MVAKLTAQCRSLNCSGIALVILRNSSGAHYVLAIEGIEMGTSEEVEGPKPKDKSREP